MSDGLKLQEFVSLNFPGDDPKSHFKPVNRYLMDLLAYILVYNKSDGYIYMIGHV